MTSPSASSPSLNRCILRSPEQAAYVATTSAAAARFNPLFIHSAFNAAHNQNHKHNSTSSSRHNSTDSFSQNPSFSVNSSNIVLPLEERSISHSKATSNTSSASSVHPAEAPATPSRKVHVVYYLSRSGQLEHPHLLEVSIPPNQGLYLRDVKRRLAVIRGKRLPSTFAWSYKRSYKNGYVWQDLCDDDLIFPAHGCEYVLKGSEILNDQRNTAEEETTNPDVCSVVQSDKTKEKQARVISRDPKVFFYEESVRAVGPNSLHVSSMVDSGTDAATQTEDEMRPSTDEDSNDIGKEKACKGLYVKHEDLQELAKHSSSFSPQRGTCTAAMLQNAIELNKTEIASPPSSSSATNSPSPYKEIASTSSSSTSVGNQNGENLNPATELINSGSKTPGRPWMKKAIQKLEEQGEILCIRQTDSGGETDENGLPATSESASSKTKYRHMATNSVASVIMEEAEHSPAEHVRPSRGKHSNALSLLQFMSCGGLDVKEQILPMSLYRLRSKGTPNTANQFHMNNYVLSPDHSCGESFVTYGSFESGKSWGKFGKPKSLCLNGSGSKSNLKSSGELFNGESDAKNQRGHSHHARSMQTNSSSPAVNGSSAKGLGGSVPDVISIGRSSISDRSTNVSHELDYQASNVHARLKKSGEVGSTCNNAIKGSPRFAYARPDQVLSDLHNNEGARPAMGMHSARAVSGEILMSKGSPLFVPGRRHLSYSGTPLNYVASGIKPLSQTINVIPLQAHHDTGNNSMSAKQDADNKSAACSSKSCNPSRAFSDGEVSCMLANRNALSKLGDQRLVQAINGYDQSMAQLWEELLAAPSSVAEEHQQKDADFLRRVRQVTMGNSSSAWEVERTLQNAVELSLQPPLDHHLLHVDCPHCGRKVKAEQMKAHVKSCSSPKSPASSSSSSISTSAAASTNKAGNGCLSLNANLNSFGKSPKSDSNLCQRFLRASPPPTKL
ncbi:hypothetical protein L7F22_022562 [Adiantum nelumboides]|nr:hypothetical protein [Adiantum nelumboides]